MYYKCTIKVKVPFTRGVFPESIRFWESPETGFCHRLWRTSSPQTSPSRITNFLRCGRFYFWAAMWSFSAQLLVSEGSYWPHLGSSRFTSFWKCELGRLWRRKEIKKPRRICSLGSPKKKGHLTHKGSLHLPKQCVALISLGVWKKARKWVPLFLHGVPWSRLTPPQPGRPGSAELGMVTLCLLRVSLVVWFCKSKTFTYCAPLLYYGFSSISPFIKKPQCHRFPGTGFFWLKLFPSLDLSNFALVKHLRLFNFQFLLDVKYRIGSRVD